MNEEEMEKEENLEHEVIDRLRLLNELDFDRAYLDESYIDAMLKARNIILKLYNKEKEKNEELKTIIKVYDSLEGNTENKIIVFDKTSAMVNGELFINRYISKDKIREMIKEYKKAKRKYPLSEIIPAQIEALKELLGETNEKL